MVKYLKAYLMSGKLWSDVRPIIISSVFMIMLLSFGGCSPRWKNVKSHKAHHAQTIKFDINSLQGNERQKALVEEALTWLGVPYAYAKSDKEEGTDCSGLVLRVYFDVLDIKLPRNSAQQAEFCKKIKKEDLEPGDLVFFATGKDPDRISHVGIMIDKVNFIHASGRKGVVISQLDTPYYIRAFRHAGRVRY